MLTLKRRRKSAEGKTKIVYETDSPYYDDIKSKDDITAGDGKKHDILPGKGAWSNTTTCNIFRLLMQCGIPVAFYDQTSTTSFAAKKGLMISLEVVARREGWGSYLQRNPNLKKGHLFPKLVFELDLKTSGKKWNGRKIPCDDPMIVFSEKTAQLFDPHSPLWTQTPFMEIPLEQFYSEIASKSELAKIEEYTRRVFLVLEKSWQLLDHRLLDFKLEFMRCKNTEGEPEIRVADVIDSDSWRKKNLAGEETSKQIYRDGGPLAKVAEKFRETAELTSRFAIPRQQIVIWRGSPKDDLSVFESELLEKLKKTSVKYTVITCSGHKESVMAYYRLQEVLQDIPDSVVISYIGRSNGAGPTLSAEGMAPMITVPATAKEFPEDVWSSLRTPSDVPVMTILEPKNAILAAAQILALRNSAVYAVVRLELEKRTPNIILF